MIKNAKFISSAADLRGVPSLAKSEVAFLGRSNVGKSSLINALCHAKIAKSSATPGKTRLINFFDVEISANLAAKCENNGEILAKNSANFSEIQANLNRDISPTAKHNKNSSINLAQTPPPNPLPQGEGALHAQISAQNSSLNSVQTMDCRGSLREPRNVAGAANSSKIQANLSEKFRLVFVDLPGFGYAKVGKKMREAWDKNLDEFLRKRVEIRLFVHLRDARHFELDFDEEISAYLKSLAKCDQIVLCVFTKADKLNQSQMARLKAKFPNALLVSSTTRRGLKELERVILDLVLGMNLGEKLVNLRRKQHDKNSNINLAQTPPPNPLPQGEGALHAQISAPNSSLNSVQTMDCHGDFLRKSSRNDGKILARNSANLGENFTEKAPSPEIKPMLDFFGRGFLLRAPHSQLQADGGGVKFTRKNLRNSQSPNHRQIAPYMQEFSRQMRQNLTDAENKLWQILRGKQLGAKFRRQFVVDDKYIADFICLKKRLIIECDGAQHSGNFDDIERDFYLVSKNFRILRFWNNEILENLESVVWKIKETLDAIDDFKGDNALATPPTSPILKKSSIGLISGAGALHAKIYTPNSSLNSAQTPPPNPLPQGAGAFDTANLNTNLKNKVVDCFGDKSPRNDSIKSNPPKKGTSNA